jgi:hypothetical protein
MGNSQDLPSYELALRLVAMRNVLAKEPSNDYTMRYISRWYSEKYHTPLHVVDSLPRHDVLLAYYETVYSEMRDDPKREQELNEQLHSLLNPKDTDKEERERVEAFEFEQVIAEQESKKIKEPPKPIQTVTPIDLDSDEPVSMNFVDIDKLDQLENLDGLVGLK